MNKLLRPAALGIYQPYRLDAEHGDGFSPLGKLCLQEFKNAPVNATPNATNVADPHIRPAQNMSLRNPDPDIFPCLDLHDESGLSVYVFDSPDTDDALTLRIGTLNDGADTWEFATVEAQWRCPTWNEMKFVKDQLWAPEDVCLQLHPQQSRYINKSEFCLWIWRPVSQRIPQPRIWREREALHTANRLSNVELTGAQFKV